MKYSESNSTSVSGKWSTFRPVAADDGSRASQSTPGVAKPGVSHGFAVVAWVVIVGGCSVPLWVFWFLFDASPEIKTSRSSGAATVVASPSEAAAMKQLVDIAVKHGLISHVSPGLGSSSVHVLPSFMAAPIDDKNLILRSVYYHVFNLSPTTTEFSWPLHVIDGLTGRRVLTVDLDLYGLRWR